MKRSQIVKYICALAVLLASCVAVSAQNSFDNANSNYDVSLHLIIGSDEAGTKGDIPNDLGNVTKAIKNQFGFANYRLASTFQGRLANSGSFSYKSTSNIFGKESTQAMQSFLEWNIAGFHVMAPAGSSRAFVSDGFNFGARVPVLTNVASTDGKSSTITNYEPIGLTLRTVGLKENVPTMIGTLNLPGTSGTIFLVVTVRSAD
ncbi:MAG: hypothetical protein JO053_13420 [Acidobacteria bacterium]|nr:hypothetical protein [Acidobacteriota bacterium]